ncbi:MAG: DNA polymerase III subunit gamma/tau [Cyanobacteria bacterium P01_G01_bin.39]
MPYEPLHHKYRPQTFADLVGQETIALTLSNALKQERIAPAYLFTGPRGTGKTSSARILAKSLNCLASSQPTPEPCGKCEACLAIAKGTALDVMEIDAASNTGVDNIREIIERSRFAPVQCRYKIYAIDECHMLSTAAFNALLKTLEEPPPQVVFILATTDPQRVLSTIISRCQRFDYRRIPLTDMTKHLKYIAQQENIAIADDALTLIAQIANGGLRDAESLLDQLSLLPETISVAKVWDLIGAVPEQDLLILLQAINQKNSLAVLEQSRSLMDRGREPLVVLQNLASFYLNLLIAKTAPQRSEMTTVTETCWQQLCTEANNWDTSSILRGQQHLKEAETQLKQTTQPRLWLEVTLLGLLPQAKGAIANHTEAVVNFAVSNPSESVVNSQTSRAVQTATPQKASQVADIPLEIGKNVNQASLKTQQEHRQIETANKDQNGRQQKDSDVAKATVATSVSPESPLVVSPPEQKSTDTKGIWGKVVSCLQPPTTQALVKQQCHLVSFDGISAIVGISSARLQKLNQGKVPNIEAAFAQVCQHKVKVQLEVAQDNVAKNSAATIMQPTEKLTKTLPAQPLNEQTLSSTNQSVKSAPAELIKPQSPAQNPVTHNTTIASASITPVPVQPIAKSSQHQTQTIEQEATSMLPTVPLTSATNQNITSDSITESDSNYDPDPDELQQAINNLTQSFEGEIVQMDHASEISEEISEIAETSPTLSPTTIAIERPDVEDYDDDW